MLALENANSLEQVVSIINRGGEDFEETPEEIAALYIIEAVSDSDYLLCRENLQGHLEILEEQGPNFDSDKALNVACEKIENLARDFAEECLEQMSTEDIEKFNSSDWKDGAVNLIDASDGLEKSLTPSDLLEQIGKLIELKIKIKYPEDHLYLKYENQHQVQPAYIELDDGVLSADVNANIGGGTTFGVHNGTVRRWNLRSSYYRQEELVSLIDEIAELAQKVQYGLTTEFDGSNWIGQLTEKAKDAEDEIIDIIENDGGGELQVYEARDFFSPQYDEILACVKGEDHEEFNQLAKHIRAGEETEAEGEIKRLAEDSGECDILEDVESLVQSLKEDSDDDE